MGSRVEILITAGERRRILETLHLDHTCDETMVRQYKGRIFGPKMGEQIKKLYNDCISCTEHRISRSQKTNEVDYKNVFENFYPNQMVEIDYCQKGTQDYLVIDCILTGFIQVFETKVPHKLS